MTLSLEHVYKYVAPDRVDVLTRNRIRFTQPTALNDPFDLLPYFDQLAPEDQIDDVLRPNEELFAESLREEYLKWPEEARSQLPFSVVLAAIKANPELVDATFNSALPQAKNVVSSLIPVVRNKMLEVFQTEVGVLSVSVTPANNLMWAHYAAGHKGFVLELNAKHPFFQRRRTPDDEFYHLRPVHYRDTSAEVPTMIELDGDKLLCTKGAEWTYEQEWRMLAPLAEATERISINDEDVFLFDMPPEVITSVILGAKAATQTVEAVEGAIAVRQLQHVRLKRAVVQKNTSRIDIEVVVPAARVCG